VFIADRWVFVAERPYDGCQSAMFAPSLVTRVLPSTTSRYSLVKIARARARRRCPSALKPSRSAMSSRGSATDARSSAMNGRRSTTKGRRSAMKERCSAMSLRLSEMNGCSSAWLCCGRSLAFAKCQTRFSGRAWRGTMLEFEVWHDGCPGHLIVGARSDVTGLRGS